MFGKQKTILIAESDAHLLSTLSSTLSQEGYAVLRTQDGVHVIMAHPTPARRGWPPAETEWV